ncbi:ABC transporter permease [Pseudoalteromonas sp.]|uniref:ABC transporter permease n=1 Tax=Pseudoalteromonas sp. TaxID=53249 RepID=UPI0035646D86
MSVQRLTKQIKHASNSLLQAPGFTSAIVLTLSLTLACFFVVMSLFSSYFIKPLNLDDEARLVVVEQDNVYSDKNSPGYQSFQSIIHWYNNHDNFDKVAAVNIGEDVIMNLPGQPKLNLTFASDDYYDITNMPLALGSYLTPQQRLDDKSTEVLISYPIWQTYYNGDKNVLGKTIELVNAQYKIVGVVGKEYANPFMFNRSKSDLWFHFSSDLRFYNEDRPSPWWNLFGSLKLIGTLKEGETNESTKAFLHARLLEIKSEWKAVFDEVDDIVPIVTNFREKELNGNDTLAIFMLVGVVSLVLIALLNVSNLFISRAVVKHKQLALQAVLGAKRRVIFTSILVESSLLMVVSAISGLFFAAWGIKLFKFLSEGHLPLVSAINLDLTVVSSAVICCVVFAWLFAFITSRLINYGQLRTQIQSSGKGGVSQIKGSTVKLLIALQLFLATALVIGATMALNKTLETLLRPLGSEVENRYSVYMFLRDRDRTPEARYNAISDIRKAIEKIDGVARVGHGDSPVNDGVRSSTVKDMSGKETIFIPQAWVGRDYFDITGLKIIEGRTFSEAAIRGEKHEFLVSKAVNDLLKPGGSLIGEKFLSFDPDNPVEVVGITENFNHPKFFDKHQGRHFWWPSQAFGYPYIIQMEQGKTLNREKLLQAARTVDSRIGLWKFDFLEDEHAKIVHMERITLSLCIVLGIFTLVLAGIGIYGVLSYNLGLRRYEYGMRMALGAKRKRLYQQLLSDTLLPLAVAFIAAIVVMIGGYMLFKTQLSNWLLLNWLWLSITAISIVIFALFATLFPMSKLINAKPMAVLRDN